jgi:hypothetical protein
MKILYGSNEISKSLKNLSPTKIAVAYIGKDFDKFIDPNFIEAIVVSPTLGSNPKAISSLYKFICKERGNDKGWEVINFLDSLHAKIYIGKHGALVGSANLSKNALDANNLIEVCIYIEKINNEDIYNQLLTIFDSILEKAQNNYPDYQSKEEQLQQLININALYETEIRPARRIKEPEKPKEPINFLNYNFKVDPNFLVIWYGSVGLDLNNEKWEVALGNGWEKKYSDYMGIAKEDIKEKIVKKTDWVLVWRCRESDGKAYKGQKPYWLYVHRIILNGSKDKYYPHVLVEEKGETKTEEPFKINDQVFINAFNAIINKDDFAIYRPNDDNIWFAKNTINKFPKIISALQEEYRRIVSTNKVSNKN